MANDKSFVPAAQGSGSYELFNPMGLYHDEVYLKTVKNVPYMSSLSWLKSIQGRSGKRKVKNNVYSFYEEGQFMKAAATIAAIAPNGAKFDVTLSAADHSDIGGAGKTSFPVVGMTALFQDGKTTGYVESINRAAAGAHVATIKKFNPSQDIGTVGLVGTTIMFFSNIQKERSGKTESRVPQFEKITNRMQIVREYYDTTDLEVQNELWFETEEGKRYLWYKGIGDTAQRFEFQKETAVLLTPQASGLTDVNSNTLNSAFGLIPQIDQNGINLEYYNKPDGASFDEVMLALDNNYAEKSYMVGHGFNLMLKLKDWLVEFGQNGTGNISFSPFNGGESQAVSLKFKSYSVGAYEFYFQNWDLFSHKDSLGAANLPFRHTALFLPSGMTANPDPDRPAGAELEPYIQLVSPDWGVKVQSHITYKDEDLMWETGALAKQGATSDILEKGVHMVSYLGMEVRCRHKFAKWELA